MSPSSLHVAIQMDPIETIDIRGDSTFALGLEAQRRGHRLSYYLTRSLAMRDGKVSARACPLELRVEQGRHAVLGESSRLDLDTADVVLMRQDPPFNMNYITATHLLERIHPETLVVNDPAHVRNAPEKLLVTEFEGVMPPTLITQDESEIRDFRKEFGDIIVKPLYGNGGTGVFRIRENDENLNTLLEIYSEMFREPLVIQKYLPEVRRGDKRILLVEGEPVGAINRVPPQGELRSNMHVGGKAQASDLTPRDRELCARIGPALRERGLIFAGIDVIGGYLTEINVTSPTGIQETSRFEERNIAGLVWDAIEDRV